VCASKQWNLRTLTSRPGHGGGDLERSSQAECCADCYPDPVRFVLLHVHNRYVRGCRVSRSGSAVSSESGSGRGEPGLVGVAKPGVTAGTCRAVHRDVTDERVGRGRRRAGPPRERDDVVKVWASYLLVQARGPVLARVVALG
jgi:hypothetical protein